MAKVNRFYLLIAALICSKSYMISDAHAYSGSGYTLTDAECMVTEDILLFINSEYGADVNVLRNYEMESNVENWCDAQVDVTSDEDGSKAWYNEVWENNKIEIADCAERNLSLRQCSYEYEWGCNTAHCDPGWGYDIEKGECVQCSSGQYSKTGEWAESGTDTYYGQYCAACPKYNSIAASSTYPATSQDDCYIASNKSWTFSDSTGNGAVFFGYASGPQDCYYDGTLGS